jgi:hypothetical protein
MNADAVVIVLLFFMGATVLVGSTLPLFLI